MDNEKEEKIEQIEFTMDQAKAMMDMRKSVQNLRSNPDFVKVVINGYFKEEASRTVLLKGDPAMQEERSQKLLDKAIIGIGCFHEYLRTTMLMGEQAERTYMEHEQSREEILEEPN